MCIDRRFFFSLIEWGSVCKYDNRFQFSNGTFTRTYRLSTTRRNGFDNKFITKYILFSNRRKKM